MGKLDPKLENHLRISEESIQRLACIISDFLDLSKLDVGKMNINAAPLSVQTAIEDISEMLRFATDEKGIALEVSLPEQECIINADHDKLVQILTNLVDNAIKFVPEVNGTIIIRAKDLEDKVGIEVEDNGPGIEGDDINLVFDRFVQVKKHVGPGKHGTGPTK